MTRINRRRLLKYSGVGAIAASTGGIAAILASRQVPAYGQATSIHWLRWSDFVPASDQLLKSKIVPQCEKALGIKLNLEMINANDIQARITAAIQSGHNPRPDGLFGFPCQTTSGPGFAHRRPPARAGPAGFRARNARRTGS
jgi:multiple sugar transport system substrate-binding protein